MQHILVHVHYDLGPIGAWSYHDTTGQLTQYYTDSLDLDISGRARHLMAARTTDVVSWFEHLSTLTASTDTYTLMEATDDIKPADVVAAYRRVWSTTV